MSIKQKQHRAHRISYMLANEAIPDGMLVRQTCGNKLCVRSNHLILTTSSEIKSKNWMGQKFGRLTFVRPTERRYGNNVLWEMKCDCGNIAYCMPSTVTGGHNKSCGCHRREQSSKNGLNVRRHHPMISTARQIWRCRYKDGDIDFESFYRLSQQNCYYCGSEPHRTRNIASDLKNRNVSDMQKETGNFTYNGLDRIDSNRKHTLDNVVTCCSTCNYMKRDMAHDEFLEHIERVFGHTRSLRSHDRATSASDHE